jgi:cell division transport system permease protein
MTQPNGRGRSRILPRDKGAAPLDVVIAIMAFLAALALGAALLAERAAIGWRQGLADRLTVQIVPASGADNRAALENEAATALGLLRETRGVAHAAELSDDETAKLVEPWLGRNALIPELPMPKLIDATLVPGEDVDLRALSRRLKGAAPHAVLDDHSRWIGRLKGLADTVTLSAYGLLLLIAIAMAATVSFATRAGLDAHHEKVELLHQMGAQSGFIARAFETHYLVSAFFAGLAGAGAASIIFAVSGGLEFVGVPSVPFLPPLALKLDELAWLAIVPAAAAAIAFATARLSVLAALRDIY